MAAPVASTRLTPGGKMIGDGFGSLIVFAKDRDIQFREVGVTPPGVETDDPTDTSTHHNVKWRTFHPRQLARMTPAKATVNYDPAVYVAIVAALNRQDTITVVFPDGATLAFYGYLSKFEPNELKEGQKPEANIEVVVTNADPSDCSEQGPVYAAGTGTGCY